MIASLPPGMPRRLVGDAVAALILPLLMWLAVSFAASLVLGALHRPGAVVAWLDGVEAAEARGAAMATPSIVLAGRELVARAWPYARARATVDARLPGGDRAFAATAPPSGPAARVVAAAGAWVDDAFLPVQRRWCAIALTRAWYAAAVAASAMPACALAFCLGEWRARRRRERGDQPLGHRYRWWATTARFAVAAVPSLIVAPAPLPAVPSLIAAAALAGAGIAGARAHALDL